MSQIQSVVAQKFLCRERSTQVNACQKILAVLIDHIHLGHRHREIQRLKVQVGSEVLFLWPGSFREQQENIRNEEETVLSVRILEVQAGRRGAGEGAGEHEDLIALGMKEKFFFFFLLPFPFPSRAVFNFAAKRRREETGRAKRGEQRKRSEE